MKNKWMIVSSVLLCGLMLLGLFGCNQEPVSGGTTDKTDYNAPKVIKSKEITKFYATFYPAGEWLGGDESMQYVFEVKKDAEGKLTASESKTGISVPADKTMLKSLQDIIDKYKLVKNNGVYRVTAGLAPECQECSMNVSYASGEELSFTANNDPYAEWEKEMYMTFASWFSKNGDKILVPPQNKE